MKKAARKALAILLSAAVTFCICPGVGAAANDTSTHWAAKEIKRWIESGIVEGYGNGSFKPDSFITRAEFATIMNNIFKYALKGDKAFLDVPANKWYLNNVMKVAEAGIIVGDNGKFRPDDYITRQEAALVFYRAFCLKVNTKNTCERYCDCNKISDWSRDAVSALSEKGFISGKANNNFAPGEKITRAEVVKIIDNMIGQLVNKTGTATGNTAGNLVVNTGGVILKDMIIEGNLYLTEGIGDGEVTLDNVTVKGDTIVKGGGENSIVISNSSLNGELLVIKQDGKVRILAMGDAEIPQVRLLSGAKLEEEGVTGSGFSNIEIITISPGQDVKLDGDFVNVTVDADDAAVKVLDGRVTKLQVEEGAENAKIEVDSGTLDKIILQEQTNLDIKDGFIAEIRSEGQAAGSNIVISQEAYVSTLYADAGISLTGTGSVSSAIINSNGVTMENKPQTMTLGTGLAVSVGNTTIIEGFQNNNTPTPTTTVPVISEGENDTPPTPPQLSITINAANVALAVGEVKASTVSVNPGDAAISYSSGNESIARVDASSGQITGVALGSTTISVSASKSGYPSSSCSFAVNVCERSTQGNVYVSPDTATAGTVRTIFLNYRSSDEQSNETVVFNLPQEFTASTNDYFNVLSGQSINLTSQHMSNSGHTITIPNVDLSINHQCVLYLKDKNIPANASGNEYTFTVQSDSDGAGTSKTFSAGGTDKIAGVSTISDFRHTGYTDTTASFSWIPPAGASAVELWKSTDGTNYNSTGLVLDCSQNSANITGLSPNTKYWFKLVVTGGNNAGDSNTDYIWTKRTAPVLTADSSIGDGIKITFETDSLWTSCIYSVAVDNKAVSSSFWDVYSNAIEIDGSVLKEAKTYSITVNASGYATSTVQQTISAAAVSNFTCGSYGYDSAVFTFAKPAGATSVKIEKSLDGTTWSDTGCVLSEASSNAIVTGLTPNTPYSFRLSVTGGLYAGLSNVVSFVTYGTYTGFVITDWNNTTANFTFAGSNSSDFSVQQSLDGINWTNSSVTLNDAETGKINNLTPNTYYTFRLWFSNVSNNGSSNRISLRTESNFQNLICETSSTVTGISLKFTIPDLIPSGTTKISIEASTDSGQSFSEIGNPPVHVGAYAIEMISSLILPNTVYVLRFNITGGIYEGYSNTVTVTTPASAQ